jgi:hypothetical protein
MYVSIQQQTVVSSLTILMLIRICTIYCRWFVHLDVPVHRGGQQNAPSAAEVDQAAQAVVEDNNEKAGDKAAAVSQEYKGAGDEAEMDPPFRYVEIILSYYDIFMYVFFWGERGWGLMNCHTLYCT